MYASKQTSQATSGVHNLGNKGAARIERQRPAGLDETRRAASTRPNKEDKGTRGDLTAEHQISVSDYC